MKQARMQIRKRGIVRIKATNGAVKLTFPKQAIGHIGVYLMTPKGKVFEKGKAPRTEYDDKFLRGWILYLHGDNLVTEKVSGA